MKLKWLLVGRITFVAVGCLLAGSLIAIYRTSSLALGQNTELAQSVGRQLNLQLWRIETSLDLQRRFPDWEIVTSYALQPGQCVQLLNVDGSVSRSSCEGVDTVSNPTPEWFVEAYAALLGGEARATAPVSRRDQLEGTVVTTFAPTATAGEAWRTIAPLLGFASLLIAILCAVSYVVIDRALNPTAEILGGLDRLAKGHLDTSLPPFQVAEMNRISEMFNALVRDLRQASSERSELARRLVDAQERERRHIARELHDEIAQKLSALSALAACLRIAAHRNAAVLESEAKELEEMASSLMVSLRKTLAYLRPQEIDDIGLLLSLEGLVERHNKDAHGRTRYMIEARGNVEQMNSETQAHVYRIIQEALTNATKHANARHVKVTLNEHADDRGGKVELSVTDDGDGQAASIKQPLYAGSGLIGMRERVLALSGSFDAGPLTSGGFGLRVQFPSQQGAA